jgi:RNA-directed DNA polymerase
MAQVTSFLERKLRLRVNREKSGVAPAWERKFLGHRLLSGGRLGLAPESLKRAKARTRQFTRRNRGISLEGMSHELNSYLMGWVAYFRYAECRGHLRQLDGWIRRNLRCVLLKQRNGPNRLPTFGKGSGCQNGRPGCWLGRARDGGGWLAAPSC